MFRLIAAVQVQKVAGPVCLGRQIGSIVPIDLPLKFGPADDRDSSVDQGRDLFRVVGQKLDLRHAKIAEDLRRHLVAALVGENPRM